MGLVVSTTFLRFHLMYLYPVINPLNSLTYFLHKDIEVLHLCFTVYVGVLFFFVLHYRGRGKECFCTTQFCTTQFSVRSIVFYSLSCIFLICLHSLFVDMDSSFRFVKLLSNVDSFCNEIVSVSLSKCFNNFVLIGINEMLKNVSVLCNFTFHVLIFLVCSALILFEARTCNPTHGEAHSSQGL